MSEDYVVTPAHPPPPPPRRGHTVEVDLDPRWGLASQVVCPFDPEDATRPCWPHDESGVPQVPGGPDTDDCMYHEWWTESQEGGGPVTRRTKMVFELSWANWANDHFVYELGELLRVERDGDTPETQAVADEHEAIEEYHALVTKLGKLLTGVANALKGPPPELVWHDWSDLPVVAARVMADLVHLAEQLGDRDHTIRQLEKGD